MITIQELLYNRGLPKDPSIKLVRHKDKRHHDLYEMYQVDKQKFLEYQSTQRYDIFKNSKYIVSFIGESGIRARFIGVFEVLTKKQCDTGYYYEFREVEGFEDIKERVVILWQNTISWHQKIVNDMEVVEISRLPMQEYFHSYDEIILTFPQLKNIIGNNFPDWMLALSVVNGVYLITDTKTGKQYVGSAYGEGGIWARWREYYKTNGSGNNKMLEELVKEEADYALKHFQFSILLIMPKTTKNEDVIKKEQLYKKKLGSNTFGLNEN